MKTLQAVIDDSYGDHGSYVLAGHIASAASWKMFAEEWRELLPFGVMARDRNYRFKMKEMSSNSERLARVPAFFRVIERHVLMSVSCVFRMEDAKAARERLFVSGLTIDWGEFTNPYFVAFRSILDMFHTHFVGSDHGIFAEDEGVEFIFDNQSESELILSFWDEYLANRPTHLRRRFGPRPVFRSDDEFLPLQAADFWAWWVRRWYETGEEFFDFGAWRKSRRPHYVLKIEMGEDALVKGFLSMVRDQIEPGRPIYDLKSNTKVSPADSK